MINMSRKELIPFVLLLLIPKKTALISKIYFKNTPSKALFSLGVFFPAMDPAMRTITLGRRYNVAAFHYARFMRIS